MNTLAADPARWPRVWGEPCARGVLRRRPADFQVTEQLSFEPSGSGEHALLQIRKSGENTLWVAKQLARVAGVKPRDVGYAGLKDRNAVTTQWFSVGLAGRAEPDWNGIDGAGTKVLRVERHHRKLRPGALRGNRFHIRITDCCGNDRCIDERLNRIAREGVPNYFGEQRFGRHGDNVEQALALFAGRVRMRDGKRRGLLLSAARSWLFNELLARRIAAGDWNRAAAGDVLGLDARSAVFALEETPDDTLLQRLARLELHPTGALWGTGESLAGGAVRALEEAVAAAYPDIARGLEKAGMKQERRALRVRVAELRWEREPDLLELGFTLRSGSYATAVLREIVHGSSAARGG